MKTKHFLFVMVAVLMSLSTIAQTIYFVKTDGDDEKSGLDWENAKATVSNALTVAESGSVIFVAQGTYILTETITMKDGVNVYGGFTGLETFLSERPALICGYTADGGSSILDANASASNKRRILYQEADFNNETLWDGFVIQNGYVEYDGGGVSLLTNGKLNNCTVTNNYAGGAGGGVWSNYYSTVSNSRIINNKATGGGGISASRNNSRTKIINCLIANNTATGEGGGIVCQFADITNCTVVNNTAPTGGGIKAYSQGAAYGAIITNSIIWGNTSAQINGGGDANTNQSSSYFATQGTYNGNGSNKIVLETANTGSGSGNYPKFKSPTSIVGYSSDSENIEAILAADWSLSETSSCIDAGTPDATSLNLPALDLNGQARIGNGRIDMGAYEFQPEIGNPTAIKTAGEAIFVKVYPNPTSERIFIETGSDALPYSSLYNPQGSLLLQAYGKEVNLSGFPAGIYLLVVNGKTVQLIKE